MEKGKSRKYIIVALIAVLVAGTALGGRGIVAAASRDEAKKAALGSVPAGVTLVEQDEDGGKYEFTFRTEDGAVEYEVEVGKNNGRVKEVQMSLRDDRGAEKVVLTEAEATAVVQDNWTGAVVSSIRLVKDDGRYFYEARFEADDCYGNAEIHAETGVIVESDVKMGAPIVVPTTEQNRENTETAAAVYLTSEQIRELALAKVPEGNIRSVDFDREGNRYIYEVDLYKDSVKYEILYDAVSGEELACETEKDSWNATPVVTEPETVAEKKENTQSPAKPSEKETTSVKETVSAKETEPVKETSAVKNPESSQDLIGEDKARSIALGKAKEDGAQIAYIHLDREDGRKVYEGEMRDSRYEYEFEIDAYTGTVIDWDVDYLDWDD